MTAVRFYEGAANTGAHVGHLWSETGALLAEATFTNESVAGWQEVALTTPIAANGVYIASYHAASGYFAFDNGLFSTAGVDSRSTRCGPASMVRTASFSTTRAVFPRRVARTTTGSTLS